MQTTLIFAFHHSPFSKLCFCHNCLADLIVMHHNTIEILNIDTFTVHVMQMIVVIQGHACFILFCFLLLFPASGRQSKITSQFKKFHVIACFQSSLFKFKIQYLLKTVNFKCKYEFYWIPMRIIQKDLIQTIFCSLWKKTYFLAKGQTRFLTKKKNWRN